MEAPLLTQCLDLTKQLLNSKETFTINIKLSAGFSFKFTNIQDQKIICPRNNEPKKKSPSTIRRNAIRKQKFLGQKKNISSTPKPSEVSFECDICMFKTSCKVSLRKHIQKKHNAIPQLDGQDESFGNITSKVEDKETQTDILDTKSDDDGKTITDVKVEGPRLTAIRGHPRWFPCGTCRFEARNIEGLKSHINNMHAANQCVL